MSDYIDGFIFPIQTERLSEYKLLVEAVADIWKEHGALDYQEFIGDDMNLAGTRSFTDLIDAKEGEIVVFGWVTFKSREVRDAVNQKVATDPRIVDLMDKFDTGFDPTRMAYAGFQSLFQQHD
ncbi:MAG: DUF1428 domain-containing protein [Gammaproteobacteria bacterium]|nr:DUF1428 domain-containing protein [Gammaproteobacteria bacterium]